ncbi:MAG: UDP-glucose 6-dehydrogenase, partial [Crocinitomicaceae bacterium]|nr:UDP-glucose 6-dehydrogenase [Crocinitomicaceae bacterium]
ANFCELVGANVDKVRMGIGSDNRIGHKFLYPGVGFGGSCFPKDVNALVKSGREAGYEFEIIESVLSVNDRQKLVLIDKLKAYYGDLKGLKFAMWGVSFKPDTDDIREASSIYLMRELVKLGAEVRAFDPEAMRNAKKEVGESVSFGKDEYEILENADALLIVTEWSLFKNPDFNKMKKMMNASVIFDGRNMYELESMIGMGFYYNSIGRKSIQG